MREKRIQKRRPEKSGGEARGGQRRGDAESKCTEARGGGDESEGGGLVWAEAESRQVEETRGSGEKPPSTPLLRLSLAGKFVVPQAQGS